MGGVPPPSPPVGIQGLDRVLLYLVDLDLAGTNRYFKHISGIYTTRYGNANSCCTRPAQAGPGHPRRPVAAAHSLAVLAERASTTRKSLGRVERGDPSVSLGIYSTVLFALGMIDRLADVADPRFDAVGRELEEERLPERVRLPRRKTTKPKRKDQE